MPKDWLPNRDAALTAWYANYIAQVPAVGAALNIAEDQINASVQQAQAFLSARAAFDAAKVQLQAASDTLQQQQQRSDTAVRALVKQIKATAGVTPTQLAQLEVVGSSDEATGRVGGEKPTLALSLEGGQVVIKFKKSGHQGIHLYSRRGPEKEFVFLGADTYSPYQDTRPNLTPGQAEQREYYAFFMDRDQATGQQGDIASLAVPA